MRGIIYHFTKYAKRNYKPETIAKWLVAKGYKQVSRAFRLIARVDISDKKLLNFFIKDNFGDTSSGIPSCGIEDQKDYYRRCNSPDVIYDVPEEIMMAIRGRGAVAH